MERKQGILGGFLGQHHDDAEDGTRSDRETDEGAAPEKTEAYEEDWYRSLKALAERQQALTADDEAEERTEEPVGAAPDDQASDTTTEDRPESTIVQIAELAAVDPRLTGDAMSVPAAPAEPIAPPRSPSVSSPDPAERRAAIAELAAHELSDADVKSIGALVFDPDAEVRQLALETLTSSADRLEDATVLQALQDPSDDVRAAAVRVAAGRGTRNLGRLLPLVGTRSWPQTQGTVLEVLPGLLAVAKELGDEEVAAVLIAVGDMDPPPTAVELSLLAELKGTVGVERLTQALSDERSRLGAARLLAGDASLEALRSLSTLRSDPTDEIRAAAVEAAETLATIEPPATPAVATPEADTHLSRSDQGDRVESLARALAEADESVHHLAISGLAAIDRATVRRWVTDSLTGDDDEIRSLAISVVRALGLSEVAAEVLDLAAASSGATLDELVGTLASFRLDPGRLVGLLDAVEESRRDAAVRIVHGVGGPPVLLPLRSLLDDPSIPTRLAVLEVLSEAGEGPTVAQRDNKADAQAVVSEEPQAVVSEEPRAVEEPGAATVEEPGAATVEPTPEDRRPDEWVEAFARTLADPDPQVRVSSLAALQGLEEEVAHLLIPALGDPDQSVRLAAAERLASQPESRAEAWEKLRGNPERSELIGAMEQANPGILTELAMERLADLDQDERVMAVEVIGWGTSQACVEAAIQSLQDPVARVRRAAAGSLARLRDPSAAGALGKALTDPDPGVRVGLVRALGVIDDESVLGFLVSALSDPDAGVREVASEVLTQWSSPAVAKRLAGVLAVPGLRDQVSDVLYRIGPSSVELLIDVLVQANPAVVQTVGELLQGIAGMDELIDRMSSVDPERRLRAAEAVGAVGGPDAADALMRSLADPDERIRTRCVELLARIGDPRAVSAIESTALHDPVQSVVATAQQALAHLGGAAA